MAETGRQKQRKPVPLEAVDAAAKAYASKPGLADERWEAAILAADKARGMRVEKRGPDKNRGKSRRYRLVSRWFPIKGPVDE